MNATLSKFACFLPDYRAGKHAIGTDLWKVALLATLPAGSETTISELPVASTHGLQVRATMAVDGELTVSATNMRIRDSEPFRYLAIYNDTAAGKPLVGWYDCGGQITLDGGDVLEILFAGPLLVIPPENPAIKPPVLGEIAKPRPFARIHWRNSAGHYRVPRSLTQL